MSRLYFHRGLHRRRLPPRRPPTWALVLLAIAPAAASRAAAPFSCHAPWPHRCYFSVLHRDGTRTDFILAGGQSRIVQEATPDDDRYRVGVNAAPPAGPAACAHANAIRARRSAWCRISPVRAQGND